MHLTLLRRAWQSARSAFALSNEPAVSDLCFDTMRKIETAIMILEEVK